MGTSFAALVYRASEIPDRALSQGFAVALAGWDVPAPALQIAPLPGLPGYEVAFYESGAKVPRGAEDEAFDLACEVFEEELPPALAVLDAAAELGHADARVFALTYAEDIFHDDAWRFDARGSSGASCTRARPPWRPAWRRPRARRTWRWPCPTATIRGPSSGPSSRTAARRSWPRSWARRRWPPSWARCGRRSAAWWCGSSIPRRPRSPPRPRGWRGR